jgi:hypothetical protein
MNSISIQVEMRWGGLSYPSNYHLVLQKESPQIEFINITDGQIINSWDFRLEWKISSSVSKDFTSMVSSNGIHYDTMGYGSGGEYEIYIYDGWHTYWVKAYDKYGNWAVQNITFMIDNLRPVVDIHSPNNGSTIGSELQIEWEAIDHHSGISTIKVEVDGEIYSEHTPDETNATISLQTGKYRIRLLVYDLAGNLGKDGIEITVDSDPPYVFHAFTIDQDDLDNSVLNIYFDEIVNQESLDLQITGHTWRVKWINDQHLQIDFLEEIGFNETIYFSLTIADVYDNEVFYSKTERTPSEPYIPEAHYGKIRLRIVGSWVPDNELVMIYIDDIQVRKVILPFDDVIDKVKSGSHTLRIEVNGGRPYEVDFTVEAFETTDLGTITMEKEESDNNYMVFGLIVSGIVIGIIFMAIFIYVKRESKEYPEE